jgi:hypothetical protein
MRACVSRTGARIRTAAHRLPRPCATVQTVRERAPRIAVVRRCAACTVPRQEVDVSTLSEIQEHEIRERRTTMVVGIALCALIVGIIAAIIAAYQ